MPYVIGDVESLTGIPRNTISAWERRYHLLTPAKDPATGHRVYTEQDVALLRQVKAAIEGGQRVSDAIETLRRVSAA